MRLIGNNGTAVLTVALGIFTAFSNATSTTRNPVKALYNLRNATIHTPSKRITALSTFDLSFMLNDDDHVKLSLEPNHDILPDNGLYMTYLGQDGEMVKSEEIERLKHKVYKGTAWTRASGYDQWIQAGWARVFVKQDGANPLFDGSFSVDNDNHHIHLSKNYLRTRHLLDPATEDAKDEYMVLYRDSDIASHDEDILDTNFRRSLNLGSVDGFGTCMADQLGFNSLPEHPVHQEILRRSDNKVGRISIGSLFGKRQVDSTPTGGNSAGVNLVSTIGQTAGCPTTRRVALVGIAVDCAYRGSFDSEEAMRQNIITMVNQASNLYERTFNISLGLQNITTSDPACPASPSSTTPWNRACSDDFDIQDRLNTFSQWRGAQADNNAYWTLLSTCPTASAVGLAWLGQACVNEAQTANSSVTGNGASNGGSETVAGANVVVRTRGATEWQVFAHESGHTFGAVHDCNSQLCSNTQSVRASQCCPLSANSCDAGSRYMMNPSTSQGITDFSPCSIGNICSAIGRNSVRSSCLTDNRGVTTITGQQCGNGIVEPGEDCDCGGEAGCGDNSCCEASTCRFRQGAVCDDSNEDCCNQCQFSGAGTVCRASSGVCDPQETCTGSSPTCPDDVRAPNGQECGSGLRCASGQCTSRDQQCRTVMGSFTQNNDTSSCDSSGCQLSCASPEFGRGVCYGLQQNFLDGTSCGGGGTCQNGRCRGSSAGGSIRSWIDDNRNIVIGVAVGVGSLILFAIISCIWRRCRRRRNVKKVPPPPPGGWQGWQAGGVAPSGPPSEYYAGGGRSRGTSSAGSRRPVPPPPPPPVYSRPDMGEAPPLPSRRGTSVRYA
ncbi:Disintegrin and metalloproteinase domain-containing protein B [Sphaceloma murrayae]|uniref:Disintegrin and metalloproteinase domain-containing protein B n=1 Tax=Sphaceloma murrayae TaxID=2082308 RepID=A0A2K1QPV7_9PEZI|nr:Disintegrin and metalloproteinase domain-containing protein B [Sphaceloma murrayae]